MNTKTLGLCIAAAVLLVGACGTQPASREATPASGGTQVKLVALTFDDGPDPVMTPRVLDKLEKYGVKATFFLIGQLVNDRTKPVLDRMVAMGCEFGNHSWEWESLNNKTAEEIRESVEKTSKVIEQYTGQRPRFFRPPNLAVSDTMYEVIDLPFASGILAFDWAGQNTTAEQRAKNVLDAVRDGAIILMHDVQPEPHPTPEALDIIIPELLSQGYEFVTLSELFERKAVDPRSKTHDMWVFVE
ncbi:polysaccharide deacetylase [Spirochaeta thermophila DSM 6578]|uniref:Polysaccharide deacetylase n=1 Tax=Winmispira thermophila (strain ATCC 700085 / DSM 6578 / Z-1203) TaxID=869211 RepID=G0GAA7_WINT7|nr:polysaccharide deacetylase family protein [Spirochaeta thermophila]AEJ60943.1 polysaccharide deacetylase [Spirochaeta thermophila DSM 6578]